MPRKLRVIHAGGFYHVVNRGNDKRIIYPQPPDYERFIELLRLGRSRAPVHIVGFCLMPTHFHLVAWPQESEALSAFMQWVTGNYACELRMRTNTRGHGHVFQRRFWAAPVRDDRGFISLLRYVEANPLRARLVCRAQEWQWSSLSDRLRRSPTVIDPCPLQLPATWCEWVNLSQDESVIDTIRRDLKKVK